MSRRKFFTFGRVAGTIPFASPYQPIPPSILTATVGSALTFTAATASGWLIPTISLTEVLSASGTVLASNPGATITYNCNLGERLRIRQTLTNQSGSVTTTSVWRWTVQDEAPAVSTYPGLGYNTTTGRYILAPHTSARVILVDGTTSQAGNIYHAANLAAGKALMRAGAFGDWLLFPAGGTTTGTEGLGVYNGTLPFGVNAQYPAVWGTFDPTDPLNAAKYNQGQHTFNLTGIGPSGQVFVNIQASWHDIAFCGLTFKTGLRDEDAQFQCATQANQGVLLDGCVFDNVCTNMLGVAVAQPVSALPDTSLLRNVVYNRCGWLYGGSRDGGRSGGAGDFYQRDVAYQSCVMHHTGWSEDHTRATPSWYSSRTLTGVANQLVYSFPTMKAHTLNTPDPVTVQRSVRGGTYDQIVTLVKGTDYTVAYTATNPITTGFTITLSAGAAAAVTSAHDITIYPRSTGPDIYKHNFYIDDSVDGATVLDCLSSWEPCNAKFTGPRFRIHNFTEVRCPMGFIYAAYGNSQGASSPNGGKLDCTGHLMIESADCNTDTGTLRGMGPWILHASKGSRYANAVLINQTTPLANPGDKRGVLIANDGSGGVVSYGYDTEVDVFGGIFANWRFNASEIPTTLNVIRNFQNNVWDEPTSGTNQERATMVDTAMKAAIAVMIAKNVYTTFRTAESIPVTVDADPLITEDRVMAYMARNPTMKWWNRQMRTHFLAGIGRS